MGTTIEVGSYVYTRKRNRLEDRNSDLSGFEAIDQREWAALDGQKTLHESENTLAAQGVNQLSTAEGQGASTGGALREWTLEDALKNGLAFAGRESSSQATEGTLVDRILSGHKELFVDLIRPHQRTVYATVLGLLANKEDAEDVAQDALVKALAFEPVP